ncbi:alpha/beta hydrolase [Myxococcota bacterium]|nr:alpha/beta hydrolase [Myxococcota bacterium]
MQERLGRDTPVTTKIERRSWRLDVSHAVDEAGSHEIAAQVAWPVREDGVEPRKALCCLPGGFLSKAYFDLEVDGSFEFSFVEHMVRRGFVSICLDHLGIGESSRPRDGYAIGVDAIARANQAALEQVLERLGTGDGSPPLPDLVSVGVGHSMGSCLSVAQQARHGTHSALVLFSFTTAGLPHFLAPAELELAEDPKRAHAEIGERVRNLYGAPYPARASNAPEGGNAAYSVGTAPARAERALQQAGTNLLAVAGTLSMIPGAYRPYADEIECPVFVAVGDHDLHGVRDTPSMFPRAPEIVAYELADAWHCHNVANTRTKLWNRVARWIETEIDAPTQTCDSIS